MAQDSTSNERQYPVEISPTDNRDFLLGRDIYDEYIKVPLIYSVQEHLLPVRNQTNTMMCTAFSTACMKEYQEFRDIGLKEYISPECIYYNRPNQTTDGMHLRDAMKILHKIGACRESMWIFKTEKPAEEEYNKCLAECCNHKIAHYARCTSVEMVRRAVYLTGPVLMSVPVFKKTSNPDQFWVQESEEQSNIGGHCMTIVGYTSTDFVVRNSWGTNWGNKGYILFPISSFDKIWDIFCSYDAISDKYYNYERRKIIYKIEPEKVGKCKCSIM